MILEIQPNMYDIPETRKALRAVMKQLNILDYSISSSEISLSALAICVSEADAILFELAGGGMMIVNQYGRDGWESSINDFRN